MDEPPLYSNYAWLYDIIYKSYIEKRVPRMIDFTEEVFSREAKRRVEKVLDLACGTGEPTLELARRGYVVTGIDKSSAMIDIARDKAVKRNLLDRVKFIVNDMLDINYREEFDAVTMFFSSINYVLSDDDILQLFRRIHNALKPGGVFVADTFNLLVSANRMIEGIPVHWRVDYEDKNIVILDTVLLNELTQIIDWNRTIILQDSTGTKIIPDKHLLRGYTANELRMYARITGFNKIVFYGGFNIEMREKSNRSGRIVLVATK